MSTLDAQQSQSLDLRLLGRTDYEATVQAMQAFTSQRDAGTRDELWICEHSAHFTQGLAGKVTTC